MDEAMDLVATSGDLPDDIVELCKHCLENAYFVFGRQFYKQQ